MQQLTRAGVALAYEDVGRGAPPLLLVHDRGGDHRQLAALFAHFRRHHRVVAVDLRGHGASGGSAPAEDVVGFAEDLGWLCRELGVYRPVLIGNGLGGRIALELAVREPELPAAAVVMETATAGAATGTSDNVPVLWIDSDPADSAFAEGGGAARVYGLVERFLAKALNADEPGRGRADEKSAWTGSAARASEHERRDDVTVEANKALVRRLMEEDISTGDEVVADEIIHPNFVDHTNPPGMRHGIAGHKAIVAMFRTTFPDLVWEIDDLVAEGDKVVARTTMRGTHLGDFFGLPPTGRRVSMTGVHVMRIADGKIAEHWGSNDDLGLMRQLGAIAQ